MLHARGLQRGPPGLNIYIDCRLAHTLDDLPAAFGSLPPGPNKVALRTLQLSGQDELTDLKLVTGDTIDNVATLQDCSVGQEESVQLLDIQRTRTVHDQATMLELRSMLSEMKELLNQQIKETTFLRNTIAECLVCGLRGSPTDTSPDQGPGQFVMPPQHLTQCPPGTCFRQNMCIRSESGGFQCAPCPDGFTGDGVRCDDVDECQFNPCFPGVRCVNTAPGFRCEKCPLGYTGPELTGVGVSYAKSHKQVCDDIDECLGPPENGGCTANSHCYNTMGEGGGGGRRGTTMGGERDGDNLRRWMLDVCAGNAGTLTFEPSPPPSLSPTALLGGGRGADGRRVPPSSPSPSPDDGGLA
ncbi:thrombospondin-4-B-like protein [Lates japonicus]|uniref:Thrombospondin-4-B-like protein n=1 Tax=Lates japonicus TaxID=270547 RepID=A0AAD3RHB3_LATJO|nr:thrombospondin-4-B-like protein [Lates japonicus]